MRSLAAIWLLCACASAGAVDLIAHRANAGGEIENSLAAIRTAWAAGADGVEIDVRVSSDGVVYLFHDDEIQDRHVPSLTYQQMQRIAGDSAVQSDQLAILKVIRKTLPESQIVFLSKLKRRFGVLGRPSAVDLIDTLRDRGVNGVSLKGRQYIDRDFVEALQSSGLDVNIWTINKSDRVAYYRGIGVDGVITDRVEQHSGH